MKPRFIGGGIAVAAAVAVFSLAPIAAQQQPARQPAAQQQPAGRQGAAPQPARPQGRGGQQAADNAPTPRMGDGHPDLNGWWGGGGGGFGGGRTLADITDEKGNVFLQLNARSQGSALGTASGQLAENFERDSGIGQRADPNKPIYKPELWDKVQYNDVNGNATDPSFSCGPQGVPRMGFPNKIVSNPGEVVFLYDNDNTFRWIPINKPHNTDRDESYKGDSVATWDGDTLVIDTNNFNDQTWLGWPGYFHSDQMHVIEKLTRTGNTIKYEVTVEDPGVLQKPWVWAPRMERLNTDPKAAFWEDPPCSDKDLEHIVTKERG